ncbi:MAG TPA: hypothetical protein VJL58_10490 [Pyrinomonadaceae bacterium]|nr:hypothetical protein [Pyrinomonadaceae bacterium]
MRRFFATVLLLLTLSFAFAGPTGAAIDNPKAPVCHDKSGKWAPQDKSCDPYACGCLFHEILDALGDIFG